MSQKHPSNSPCAGLGHTGLALSPRNIPCYLTPKRKELWGVWAKSVRSTCLSFPPQAERSRIVPPHPRLCVGQWGQGEGLPWALNRGSVETEGYKLVSSQAVTSASHRGAPGRIPSSALRLSPLLMQTLGGSKDIGESWFVVPAVWALSGAETCARGRWGRVGLGGP